MGHFMVKPFRKRESYLARKRRDFREWWQLMKNPPPPSPERLARLAEMRSWQSLSLMAVVLAVALAACVWGFVFP